MPTETSGTAPRKCGHRGFEIIIYILIQVEQVVPEAA
jgi:hypothetical protein